MISDWGGVHNTLGTAKHGVDLEYGSWTDGLTMGKTNAYDSYYLAAPYKEAIQKGEIGTEELDARVKRILRLIFRTSMDRNRPFGSQTSPEHYAAARKIGAESIVLLKNDGGLLPMAAKPGKIVVVGENAVKMMTVGGGSSSLKAKLEVSPLDGISWTASRPAGPRPRSSGSAAMWATWAVSTTVSPPARTSANPAMRPPSSPMR